MEARLSVTSSMLGDMKAVKMLGLSSKMFDIISRLRNIEIDKSAKYRKVLLGEIFFCKSSPICGLSAESDGRLPSSLIFSFLFPSVLCSVFC